MSQHAQFNILLAECDPELARLMAYTLETRFGASVFEVTDPGQAVDFISIMSNLNLVVIGDANDFQDLCNELNSRTESVPTILGVVDKVKDPTLLISPSVLGVVQRKSWMNEGMEFIQKAVFKGEVANEMEQEEFCRIPATLLLKLSPLDADIFISLAGRRYLKMFSKGDMFSKEDFRRYTEKKKVDYFFVKRADADVFLNNVKKEAERLLNDPSPNIQVINEFITNTQDSTRQTILTLGVTEEVRVMTRNNVRLALKSIGSSPKLNDLLDRFTRDPKRYIVFHSMVLAEVACALAAQAGWFSETTFQKLITAAFLHDVTLKNDELAKVKKLGELKTNKELVFLDTEEDIRLHPIRAAELLSQINDAPPDVDQIIMQHHERPDGSGFPRGMTHQQLTPLSCVFIMAHDFVSYLDKSAALRNKPSFEEFLAQNHDSYRHGVFSKLSKTLAQRGR